MVDWSRARSPFRPESADEDGLVAVGGSLDPELLLLAYRSGVFPWSSDPVVTWWSPDPRAVIDLEGFRQHRSVGRTVRRAGWTFSVDRCFDAVIRACGRRAPGRRNTWITADFVEAYGELHRLGHAHSIEVWEAGELVGGLYGVALGGFFGGESMFHRRTDASKAAVGFLVERLRAGGFLLLDAQVPTAHLMSLGAVGVPRAEFLARLSRAVRVSARLSDASPGQPSTSG